MRRLLLPAFVVPGCGGTSSDSVDYPPADLADDPVTAKRYAATSAPNVYLQAEFMISSADLTLQLNMETCPVKTVDGDVTTYVGGCTTSKGEVWTGKATVTGNASDGTAGSIVYEGFGRSGTSKCNTVDYPSSITYDGKLEYGGTAPTFTWSVRTTAESMGPNKDANCEMRIAELGVVYDDTLRQGTKDADHDGDIDDTFWNGHGQLGDSIYGTVDATTTEEAVDNQACDKEALSGTTTASAGGHSISIVYDGATDCNAASTVHWQYDGADRGELSGVQCGASGSSRGAWFVVGAVLLARRRRRRR